jgi:hypothetical protein
LLPVPMADLGQGKGGVLLDIQRQVAGLQWTVERRI